MLLKLRQETKKAELTPELDFALACEDHNFKTFNALVDKIKQVLDCNTRVYHAYNWRTLSYVMGILKCFQFNLKRKNEFANILSLDLYLIEQALTHMGITPYIKNKISGKKPDLKQLKIDLARLCSSLGLYAQPSDLDDCNEDAWARELAYANKKMAQKEQATADTKQQA